MIISSPTMSMKAETIRTISLPSADVFGRAPCVPLMRRSSGDDHRGDTRRQEARDAAAEQCLQAELRECRPLIRSQRADSADLDTDGRDVREAAQRVGQNDLRPRIRKHPRI